MCAAISKWRWRHACHTMHVPVLQFTFNTISRCISFFICKFCYFLSKTNWCLFHTCETWTLHKEGGEWTLHKEGGEWTFYIFYSTNEITWYDMICCFLNHWICFSLTLLWAYGVVISTCFSLCCVLVGVYGVVISTCFSLCCVLVGVLKLHIANLYINIALSKCYCKVQVR